MMKRNCLVRYCWFIVIATFSYLTSSCVRISSRPQQFPTAAIIETNVFVSNAGGVAKVPSVDVLLNPFLQSSTGTVTQQPSATLTITTIPPQIITTTPTPTSTLNPELYLDQNYYCREEPDIYSEEVWSFTMGMTLKVLYAKNNWYLIEFSDPRTHDTACWIGGGIVQDDENTSEVSPQNPEYSIEEPYIHLPQNTRCREGNSKIFGDVWFFEAGTSLNIIAVDEIGWYKVEFYDPRTSETTCWIGIGEVHGDTSSLPIIKIPDPLLQHLQDVTVSQREVTISLWDKGLVDGDRIRLTVNDQILIHDYIVTSDPFGIALTLNQGENTIYVTALNEGTDPPNTVQMHISHVVSGPANQEAHAFSNINSQIIITAP